jgi:SOS-response transcriptional repressor LexA
LAKRQDVTSFGTYARERLHQTGKSQKALAAELGVSPAYISQIFTGKKNPPDLGKPRNRSQLRTWAEFLGSAEEDLLDLIRYELHRVPPRPTPRFGRMRTVLLKCLAVSDRKLIDEIRGMELHPAEGRAIHAMTQIYVILQEEVNQRSAYSAVRFREFCNRARANRRFIEEDLASFFDNLPFSWSWDAEVDDVRFLSESSQIREAMTRIDKLLSGLPGWTYGRTVPVVAHVSAGEGFVYTDGGYEVGEGFEQVEIPPGVDLRLAERLYCVKVRGDSLREFFGDGTLLFIKPESWEEIKDGDLVIFKDRSNGRAFAKKVEFAGDSLILKSMNPLYKNIVLRKRDLILLERVTAVVFA